MQTLGVAAPGGGGDVTPRAVPHIPLRSLVALITTIALTFGLSEAPCQIKKTKDHTPLQKCVSIALYMCNPTCMLFPTVDSDP